MAKKKRKKGKRPVRPVRPATTAAAPAPERREAAEPEERPEGRSAKAASAAAVSNRQARKEQARRDRERRIRRARRRQRMRRVVRWAAVLGAVGGIVAAIWYVNTRPLRLENAAAAEAAAALGCGDSEGNIDEPANQGGGHLPQGATQDYTSTPGTSGPHAAAPYAGEPVIEQPVDPVLEAQLVHNLEHAYVIMYYRQDGPEALPDEVLLALTNLAQGETKVLLAPYPELPDGTSLLFAAWTKLLRCPGIDADEADEAVEVARGFIDQYRGTANAPEPQGG